MIAAVEDRTRPLWQRLMLIGSLCMKLNAMENAEQAQIVPKILADYWQTLGTDWATEEMDKLAGPPEARLRLVTRLTEAVMWELNCGTRFRETYNDYHAGIQNDVLLFLGAEKDYFLP